MVVSCAIRAVAPGSVVSSKNIFSINKTGVGAYTVTLASTSQPPGYGAMSDGYITTNIFGPYKIDSHFASANTITVQILSLPDLIAVDPVDGTEITIVAFQG